MKYEEIVRQFQHNVFGNLTTIRSFKNHNKIWLLGTEIQKMLGHTNITQAIKAASLEENEIFVLTKALNPEFWNEFATNLKLVAKVRSITFISESGLYKLLLRSRKPEFKIFYNWVTVEVLPTLRQTVDEDIIFKKASAEIEKHMNIEHQKFESKRINKMNINSVGVAGTVKYNRDSCFTMQVLHQKV